jgi:hypothetical protein
VSIARRNLKEAVGKALARRSGITYEVPTADEKVNIFSPCHYDVTGFQGGIEELLDQVPRERRLPPIPWP